MPFRPVVFFLVVLIPSAAAAQPDRALSAGITVSALNMQAQTSTSIAGAVEFRFNRVAGIEVEGSIVPRLGGSFPTGSFLPDGSVTTSLGSQLTTIGSTSFALTSGEQLTNATGRAVLFTNAIRLHVPTTAERLDPYVVAGGGIASLRHTADLTISFPTPVIPREIGIPIPVPTPRPITEHLMSSSMSLALALGGGADVRVASQLWVGADLRLIRLVGSEDRNIGRFGVTARYRF
jgi:hypothetical protein